MAALAGCAPKAVPGAAAVAPATWAPASPSYRTGGLPAARFDQAIAGRSAASFFLDADLAGPPDDSSCGHGDGGVTCKLRLERVLFDLRSSSLPRRASPRGDGADGGLDEPTQETEFLVRRGPVKLWLRLNPDGSVTFNVQFPPEAELDEQPILGTRCSTLYGFAQAVKAVSGQAPRSLALLEYSDWAYMPRADTPLNSPPVISLFVIPLDEHRRRLAAGPGFQLAAAASFILDTRTLQPGLVLLRREGSQAPPWLERADGGPALGAGAR